MSDINKHMHVSIAELKQYIINEHELSHNEKEQIELELQVCDTCSERYVELLEALSNPVHQQDEEQWDKLLARIELERELSTAAEPAVKRWYEHSAVHVVAAASITGLLFVSGFISVFANFMVEEESKGLNVERIEAEVSTPKLEQYEWALQLQEQWTKLINIKVFEGEE